MRKEDDQALGRQHWGIQELSTEEDGYDGTSLGTGMISVQKVDGERQNGEELFNMGEYVPPIMCQKMVVWGFSCNEVTACTQSHTCMMAPISSIEASRI